jgi:hypothetical protein
MDRDTLIKKSVKLAKFNADTAEVNYYEEKHDALEFRYNPSEALSELLGNAQNFSQDWQE